MNFCNNIPNPYVRTQRLQNPLFGLPHYLPYFASPPPPFKVSVVGANSKMLIENAKIVPVGELEF